MHIFIRGLKVDYANDIKLIDMGARGISQPGLES